MTSHSSSLPAGLWRALALPAAALLFGCSSTVDSRQALADQIDACKVRLDASEILEGHEELVEVISQLDGPASDKNFEADFAHMRMVSEAMLVALHAKADSASGFLKEPSGFSFDPGSIGTKDVRTSVTAHRLAAIYHTWRLYERKLELTAALLKAPPVEGGSIIPKTGDRLLKGKHVETYGALIVTAALAELGFKNEAEKTLLQLDHHEAGQLFRRPEEAIERTKPTATRELYAIVLEILDEFQVPKHLRFQILSTAHDIFRKKFEDNNGGNPTYAYQFGCLAAFGEVVTAEDGVASHSGYNQDPVWREAFYDWLGELAKSDGSFVMEGKPLGYGMMRSNETFDPAIEFRWQPK